jgi:hypothetical protein
MASYINVFDENVFQNPSIVRKSHGLYFSRAIYFRSLGSTCYQVKINFPVGFLNYLLLRLAMKI